MKLHRLFFLWMIITLPVFSLFGQWGSDVRLTYNDSTSTTFLDYAWCLGVEEDTVHVVWEDNRDGNWEVYYKRSLDGGVTWGDDTILSDFPNSSMNPSIGVEGNVVHVVWSDERDGNSEIYYKRSTDNGVTWGPDVRLTSDTLSSEVPSLTVLSDNVHVVWHDERAGNNEIYYKCSTDGGLTWNSEIKLTDDVYPSLFASVGVSGSVIHVVWYKIWDIFYKRSTDNGTSWESEVRLTNDLSLSLFPSIAVSGDVVHVVWHDQRNGNIDVFYKRSIDSGITWSVDTNLTINQSSSNIPTLASSGDNVHVAWYDNRDGNYEIYYKHSSDNGVTWEVNERLTDYSNTSKAPCIAASGQCVHVVWVDERDGNYEIYYKQNPTGNPGIEEHKDPRSESRDMRLVVQPNPFRGEIKISLVGVWGYRCIGEPEIKIFDVCGREVWNFPISNFQFPIVLEWSGEDDKGRALPPGIYFISANGSIKKKVVKVR